MKQLAYATALALGAMLAATPAWALTAYNVSIIDVGTAAENGYVSRTLTRGVFVQTPDVGQALMVIEPEGSPGNVQLNNAQGTKLGYLGAVAPVELRLRGFAPGALSADGFEAFPLAATESTTPGVGPVFVENSYSDANEQQALGEAAIWSLSKGSRLLPQWVNPDGSTPRTSVMQFEDGSLFLTGNPDPFTQEGAREVQLALVLPPEPPTNVPEPATLALLGAGIAAAALARRRKRA